jgi:hypothetical protein
MPRVLLLLIVIVTGACSSAKKPFGLPETAPGGWRLKETTREGARTLGVYEGQGTVRVEVEDMGAQAVAFERAQRTRPQPDTVFFDKDGYFVTVRWEGVDREALRQLVRELEKKP